MTTTDVLVRQLAPVRDEELAGLARSEHALALREEIVAEPVPARTRPVAGSRRRWAVAAAAALVVAAAAVAPSLVDPPPAAAGVHITAERGWFVARVTDLAADPEAMEAAFRERGLRVKLGLVAASPSMVGRIVAMSDNGRSGIEPLAATACAGAPTCETVGVRIPFAYEGKAEITLGRPARPGERYTSAAISAFSPGEALHCSGLHGSRVKDFVVAAAARGLRVDWHVGRNGRWSLEPRPPAGSDDHFVLDVSPAAAGRVVAGAYAQVPSDFRPASCP